MGTDAACDACVLINFALVDGISLRPSRSSSSAFRRMFGLRSNGQTCDKLSNSIFAMAIFSWCGLMHRRNLPGSQFTAKLSEKEKVHVKQLLRIEAGPSPRTSQRTDKWRRTISDRKLQIINTQTLILRSKRAGRITVQHADGMKATLEVNRFRLSIQLVLDSVRCTEKDIRMAMEIKLPTTA